MYSTLSRDNKSLIRQKKKRKMKGLGIRYHLEVADEILSTDFVLRNPVFHVEMASRDKAICIYNNSSYTRQNI